MRLQSLGGLVRTSHRIHALDEIHSKEALTLCDVTPHQLLSIAGRHFSHSYKRTLERFEYGPGAFKVDYALSEPIPWRAAECRRAITAHIGGTFEEIAYSEYAVSRGDHPKRPFVLLAQPTLFDPTRAPENNMSHWRTAMCQTAQQQI